MHLFAFAPEIVDLIFEEFAYSRELKRFMRLRLVSRQFKYFVDDTIFRLRLLDTIEMDVDWKTSSCRFDQWRAFLVEYIAYQAWIEQEPKSLLYRIRRAAVAISEQVGDVEETAVKARLKSLSHLALVNGGWSTDTGDLFYSELSLPLKFSDEELEADFFVAAVYLGYRSHVEKIISQGFRLFAKHVMGYNSSRVFGAVFDAAFFKGDVSILRVLHSSDLNLDLNSRLYHLLQEIALKWAAIYGHKEVFDFALDSMTIGLDAGVCEEYYSLRKAVLSTRHPENYKRGVSMFQNNTSLLAQVTRKAGAGHVDMVKYLLNQVPWPNLINGSKSDYIHNPLLEAVQGGNPDIVKLLLDHGADPNPKLLLVADTALMFAARLSRLSMAKMLLEAGANVNEGCTPPIILAVLKENMDMFRLLRQYGAKLNTPETGNWAMAVAEFYELESMVDVLVQEGVERGMILRRCPGRTEIFHQYQYLFPYGEQF
ncbi:ankyrin repeat-containing domain protein [Annulohypoxylon truncatum]|uniref:ankyrin repeat-containing domain protein n=1 Tax=Annulohypoxylon truncatum TaxID=327061 RepID=UPI002007FBE6|nr:ankyrin repeat-containing domain protein [Annulohypoxylon truncatum]KAI1210104.1 ankyrin repeat-containing domain protein [Annulohypoxylon truncatum]